MVVVESEQRTRARLTVISKVTPCMPSILLSYLGRKDHCRRSEWIVTPTSDIQFKDASFIGSLGRPSNPSLPDEQIVGRDDAQVNIVVGLLLGQDLQLFAESFGSSQ